MKKLLKNKYTKVGILGGTFDPPHIGHLHISKIAMKKLKLDNVMWVVTKHNPMKVKPYLNTKIRIRLSKKITENQKKIFVKYLDNKVKSKNTFDLLNYLKKKNKKIKLFLLIGADNLIKFHKWKKWKKIPEIAKIVVFARSNCSTEALNSIASKKYSELSGFEYTASKCALSGIVRQLAIEWSGKGIMINSIFPSMTNTSMLSNQFDDHQINDISDKLPLKKLATTLDSARAIEFLLNPENNYITGTGINVTGGSHLDG